MVDTFLRIGPLSSKTHCFYRVMIADYNCLRPEDAVVWAQSMDTHEHTMLFANLALLTTDWCVTPWTVIEACVLLLSQSGGSQLEQMEHPPV